MSEVHCQLPEPKVQPQHDLASTLASRICHDIISPLGAIANGVELLLLSGVERTPEMELIAESVEAANARIRFFRLAYGTAGPQPIGRAEVMRTLAALGRTGRLAYDWTAEGDHPRDEVKAVFLLIQCAEAALPMGGSLRVARDAGLWEVTGEGPRLRADPAAWEALSNGASPPEGSGLVQFALLQRVLADLGRVLELNLGPERILVRF